MGIIIILCCIIALLLYAIIKLVRTQEQEKIETQGAAAQLKVYQDQVQELKDELPRLKDERDDLLKRIERAKTQIESDYCDERENIKKLLDKQKAEAAYASEQYIKSIENNYSDVERTYDSATRAALEKYNEAVAEAEQDYNEATQKLQDIKDSLSAAAEAARKQKERDAEMEYYMIQISKDDEKDILALLDLKSTFRNKNAISKLIWSEYLQKKTSEMCARVLGTGIKCGIYKLTDMTTNQCYIGQSVNVSERFKQHTKCGCGIDAPSTNRLYNTMQENGVWNYTFELLEECPKDKLNEREKFWIDLYQSNKNGLNVTKGNG